MSNAYDTPKNLYTCDVWKNCSFYEWVIEKLCVSQKVQVSLDFTQIFSEILWNGSESECTIIFKYFSSKRSLHRFAFVEKYFLPSNGVKEL